MGVVAFWSRIERTSPARVVVAEHGRVQLRVEGRGFGWLRCGSERRFVVGRFSEVLTVDARRPCLVELSSLFGRTRRHLELQPRHALLPPAALPRPPRAHVFRSLLTPHVTRVSPRVRVSVGTAQVSGPSPSYEE